MAIKTSDEKVLLADVEEAKAYMATALARGYYKHSDGERLHKLLKDLVYLWFKFASYAPILETPLQAALFQAAPAMPEELITTGLTALRVIQKEVLRIASRFLPKGLPCLAHLVDAATDTLNRQEMVRCLDDIMTVLMNHPLP